MAIWDPYLQKDKDKLQKVTTDHVRRDSRRIQAIRPSRPTTA